ncbi:MAG: ATP-binding protein [Synechococcaceae cyanobacterium SM2_3_2]|nr:ATP-binding protein [Synechococcaceae cyanobacterium SM2_3_2]
MQTQTSSLTLRKPQVVPGSPCYRSGEQRRIVAGLLSGNSLLVVGEPGSGKSTLAHFVSQDLTGFRLVYLKASTPKQMVETVAEQLGVDPTTLEGKKMTLAQLQTALFADLMGQTAIFICDDAEQYPLSFRQWLESLLSTKAVMLVLATWPPAKDLFLKLPRLELDPLPEAPIRDCIQSAATELGTRLKPGQISNLMERCGGNPMLARRVVLEEYLGLKITGPDHTQWIDGTPFLVAGLMCFTLVRFLGLGFSSTSLYLLGAILTVVAAIARLLLYSLPRRKGRLGQR